MKLEVIFDNKLLWIGVVAGVIALVVFALSAPLPASNYPVERFVWICFVSLLMFGGTFAATMFVVSIILTPVAWYLRARGVDGASRDEAVAFVFKCLWQTALWMIAGYIVWSLIGKVFRSLSEAAPTVGLVLGGLWMAYLVVWQPKLLNDERKRRNSLNVVDLSRSRNLQVK